MEPQNHYADPKKTDTEHRAVWFRVLAALQKRKIICRDRKHFSALGWGGGDRKHALGLWSWAHVGETLWRLESGGWARTHLLKYGILRT